MTQQMLTNNFNVESDFFNEKILFGKTIQNITISQEDDEKYISIYFSDSSCLDLVLNDMSDILYMETLND